MDAGLCDCVLIILKFTYSIYVPGLQDFAICHLSVWFFNHNQFKKYLLKRS